MPQNCFLYLSNNNNIFSKNALGLDSVSPPGGLGLVSDSTPQKEKGLGLDSVSSALGLGLDLDSS